MELGVVWGRSPSFYSHYVRSEGTEQSEVTRKRHDRSLPATPWSSGPTALRTAPRAVIRERKNVRNGHMLPISFYLMSLNNPIIVNFTKNSLIYWGSCGIMLDVSSKWNEMDYLWERLLWSNIIPRNTLFSTLTSPRREETSGRYAIPAVRVENNELRRASDMYVRRVSFYTSRLVSSTYHSLFPSSLILSLRYATLVHDPKEMKWPRIMRNEWGWPKTQRWKRNSDGHPDHSFPYASRSTSVPCRSLRPLRGVNNRVNHDRKNAIISSGLTPRSGCEWGTSEQSDAKRRERKAWEQRPRS